MRCDCAPPQPGHEREGHRDHLSCTRCGRLIDERLVEPDAYIQGVFDHVESSAPKVGTEPEPVWQAFRRQCEYRERTGRPTFGYRFMGRDNCADALEELADYTIYMLLEQLKMNLQGGEPQATAYQGIWHAYMAYRCACETRAKIHGSP